MKIPERLEDWTYEAIKSLLEAGAFELDRFDFKETLPYPTDSAGKLRLRKAIVAFANSGGGFLIFGVKDDRSLPANERIVGITDTVEFPRDFGTYPASCEPSVEWRPRATPIRIPGTSQLIHVIEILSTWRRPHAVGHEGGMYFVKRTNQGDEKMSFSEVRSAFQEAEFRRSSLSLLVSELSHMRSVAEEMESSAKESGGDLAASPDRPWSWSLRYSTMLLDTVLGNSFHFLADDPSLWALLCKIREKARSSNALSEAIASAVFFRISERVPISDTRVRHHIANAWVIIPATKEAEARIKKLQ